MIRIVLDTNVLVAGLLSDKGPPGKIVDLIITGEIEIACDSRILAEHREVVARPKLRIKQDDAEDVLQHIEHTALRVRPRPWLRGLPDPDDEAFSRSRTRHRLCAWSPATPNTFPATCAGLCAT